MRRWKIISQALIFTAFMLPQCNKEQPSVSDTKAAPSEHIPHIAAVPSTFHRRQTVTGLVIARRAVTLRAAHAGRVADCPWEVDQNVARDQVLLRLTGPWIEGPRQILEKNIAILLAEQAKSQADLDRYTQLMSENIVASADKGLIAARSALQVAESSVARAREELKQLEASAQVIIPVAGRIIELPVRNGTDVEEGAAVAVLSVLSDLAIEATVLPVHDIRVHIGLRANVFLGPADDNPLSLKVDYLLPAADARSGGTIVGILPGSEMRPLRLGERVTIELIGEDVPVVIVPASAVVSRAGKTYCLRQTKTGLQAVEVTVAGSDHNGHIYLSSGIRPGEEVISEDVYGLIYRDFHDLFTFED